MGKKHKGLVLSFLNCSNSCIYYNNKICIVYMFNYKHFTKICKKLNCHMTLLLHLNLSGYRELAISFCLLLFALNSLLVSV